MGGMMGTQGSLAVLWSLLVVALVITALAGTALALARSRRHRGSPPQIPSGTSPACKKPAMRCGSATRAGRSAGRITCKARSSWRTELARPPDRAAISFSTVILVSRRAPAAPAFGASTVVIWDLSGIDRTVSAAAGG